MILKATTDDQILATRAVMRELRPNISEAEYLATIRRMMQTNGYQLVALYAETTVLAVAGYRFMEMLYCGKILYVDDLNTDERYRSQGCGKTLMEWLKAEAQAMGCGQLHLDSGIQREAAHRFYYREGLTINCFHFRAML
jgi:GNAT superfamily N-acetyltransferase